MSPIIIETQRALRQAGRIRFGISVPIPQTEEDKKRGRQRYRAQKLAKFRFTSSSRRAIDLLAARYGGEVQPWESPAGPQWEVITEATEVPVVVPPERMAFSQWYELWSAGGCKRRCDGVYQQPSGEECVCDPEDRECKPHTRISVMLVDLPGTGLWRCDTQGEYAWRELLGAMDLAQMLAQGTGRPLLQGYLGVDARTRKRPDPRNPEKTVTRNYVVPTLDFDMDAASLVSGRPVLAAGVTTADAIAALAAGEARSDPPALPAASPLKPLPPEDRGNVGAQIAAIDAAPPKARRSNSPPSVARTGLAPRTVDQAAERGSGSHGAQGDPATATGSADETAPAVPPAPSRGPKVGVDIARARVDTNNRVREALNEDQKAIDAWNTTLLEEFGPADQWDMRDFRRVNKWLDENLPEPAENEGAAPEREAPHESGEPDGTGPSQAGQDEGASQPPPPDDAPSFCADLHRKRQEIGLDDAAFDAVVSKVTKGRTTSAKELKPAEAGRVNQHLLEIEAGNLVVVDGEVRPK